MLENSSWSFSRNLASIYLAEKRLYFGFDDRMAITDWILKIQESPCNLPFETYNLEFKGNLELIFIIFQMRKWKARGDKWQIITEKIM